MRIVPGNTAQVLIVNSFNRNDRIVKERDNTHEYVAIHAEALAAVEGISFVSATGLAVVEGLASLTDFEAVDWYAGEESSADDSFDETEQSLVAAYLDGGGNLFVSGSEIGWDLGASGK